MISPVGSVRHQSSITPRRQLGYETLRWTDAAGTPLPWFHHQYKKFWSDYSGSKFNNLFNKAQVIINITITSKENY